MSVIKEANGVSRDYVTMVIHGQLFGIPVLEVQDVLGQQQITHIPLAPPEVAGSLNLRGRIVTAFDVRLRLGLEKDPNNKHEMSIVVEHKDELYSLVVDGVGEVLTLSADAFEPNPATLEARWKEISSGIYRLKDELLVVLDVDKLLSFAETKETAA